MARRPLSGRCVYCLDNFNEGTWDHVFPRAWYPSITPKNLGKWKVPCCEECNQKYSQLEQNLLIKLGLCVDPKNAKANGIADKALRSIGPKYARNESDKQKRQDTREKIKKEISVLNAIPTDGILPNFGPYVNQTPPYLTIAVEPDALKAFGCKLVRGIAAIVHKSFIEKDYEIEIYFPEDNKVQSVIELLKRYGQNIRELKPGITIQHTFLPDDRMSGLYAIEIWGKLKIYAVVIKGELKRGEASL